MSRARFMNTPAAKPHELMSFVAVPYLKVSRSQLMPQAGFPLFGALFPQATAPAGSLGVYCKLVHIAVPHIASSRISGIPLPEPVMLKLASKLSGMLNCLSVNKLRKHLIGRHQHHWHHEMVSVAIRIPRIVISAVDRHCGVR